MNNWRLKTLYISLVLIVWLTGIDVPAVAHAAAPKQSGMEKLEESAAGKIKTKLIKKYNLTDEFIQQQLDKGYTLKEIEQAFVLKDGDTKLSIDSALEKTKKKVKNTSKVTKSKIVNNATFSQMALVTEPVDPVVITRPDEAPFTVNLDNETISTLSGGLSLQETDLVLPGRNGLSFALTRIYDSGSSQFYLFDYSQDKSTDEKLFPIGKGWTWNISYIEFAGAKKYMHIAGGGTYEIDGTNNTLKGYPWKDITLSEDTTVTVDAVQSAYRLKSIQGISQYFSSDGKLIQISDNYNNTIQFKYAVQANYGSVLTSIVDAIGNTLNISYSSLQVKLTLGNKTVTYIKDIVGNKEILSQVRDSMNRVTTFDYDIKGAVYSLPEMSDTGNPYALITGITFPTGAKSIYTYEPVRRHFDNSSLINQVYRVIKRKNQIVYDDNTTADYNIKTITYTGDMASSPNTDLTFSAVINNGRTSTEFFNKKDYIDVNTPAAYYNTKVISTAGSMQQITEYTYDETRRIDSPIQITSKYVEGTNTSPISLIETTYDDYRNVTSVINPLNVTTIYTYNPTSHLLESVSEPISSNQTRYTEFTRNEQGDVSQQIVRESGPTGQLLQQVDYSNFDAYGNIGQVTVKDTNRNITTNYEYNTAYQSAFLTKKSISVVNADGQVSTVQNSFEYDPLTGNVTKSIDGNTYETLYAYDGLGRITKATNPDQSTVEIQYDDLDNILTIVDEMGMTSVTKWNPLGWNTESGLIDRGVYKAKAKVGYDGFGRTSWTEDAIGNRTTYHYDVWDRQTMVTAADLTSSSTVYDDIQKKVTFIDPLGNEVIQSFDILGQLLKQQERKPGSDPSLSAEYVYNHIGNIISAKDASNTTTTYGYDILGRLTSVLNPKQELTQYTYSMAGQLIQTSYPDQTFIQKQYDELGRLIKKIDGNQKEDKYYYDNNNNLVGHRDRKNHNFTFIYNNRNFLKSSISDDETISFDYDLAGKRTTMTDATGITSYQYDKSDSSLTQVTYPDGRTIQYNYDDNGRRDQMQDPFGANIYYSYDALNRLNGVGTALNDYEAQYSYEENGLLSWIQQKNGVKSVYAYDGLQLHTLTHQKADNTIIESYDYKYDANKNIRQRVEEGRTDTFTYDALNRVETSSQFNETYTYDSKGNRASYSRNVLFENNNTDLVYDDRDRLTQVTTASGKSVSYKYNGDNLLYERTEDGKTTRYYYDEDQVIAEANVVNGTAVLKARYIRGIGLVSVEGADSKKAYYLQNGHGDVVQLRDDSGNTQLNKYSYDIWGNTVVEEENVYNSFRYSGELWDDKTSLQYLRARWYDPSDGRFINEDTYEGQLGDPLTMNLYTYVLNNPLIYTDPSGMCVAGKDAGCYVDSYSGVDWMLIGDPMIFNNSELWKQYQGQKAYCNTSSCIDKLVAKQKVLEKSSDEIRNSACMYVDCFEGEASFSGFEGGMPQITQETSDGVHTYLLTPGGLVQCNCFVAGTKVKTDHGEKNIEDIEVGDKVLSKDETTGEEEYKEVTFTFNHQSDEIYKIQVGDQSIEATYNHPFYVKDKGWVFVKDLKVGDLLVRSDGNTLKIDSIELEQKNVTVYNMTVDEFHTYFVSELGIWVHNSSCTVDVSGLQGWTNVGNINSYITKQGWTISQSSQVGKKNDGTYVVNVYDGKNRKVGEIHVNQPQYRGNIKTGLIYPVHVQTRTSKMHYYENKT